MVVMNTLADVQLETARLILRPPRREDFDAFAASAADPEVMAFLGGPQARSTAWRGLAAMAGCWALQGFAMFSLIEKATGRWIGRAGPWQPEGWPGTEVGWALAREAHGRGLAFEAAVASIDYAFDTLGWTDVIHCIDDGNLPSSALARRLGSRPLRRTLMPPPYENLEVQVWGQTREEWKQRRPWLGVQGDP
jgi:RimJ/RimL family protein N-acetyltransferase